MLFGGLPVREMRADPLSLDYCESVWEVEEEERWKVNYWG